MAKPLYGNKDIEENLGIPKRRIINLTDKQVVRPFVDSAGAGSQRRYNYANLLEFALAEALFGFGLGVHLVRKILSELRQGEHIHSWVENWDGYYLGVAKKHIQWLKKQSEVNPHFRTIVLTDGKVLETKNINLDNSKDLALIKDRLKPPKPSGLLVCRFNEGGSVELKIIPWDTENYLATLFLGEYAYGSAGLLIVNIGKIKDQVDERLRA